jgi:hypothetical protein
MWSIALAAVIIISLKPGKVTFIRSLFNVQYKGYQIPLCLFSYPVTIWIWAQVNTFLRLGTKLQIVVRDASHNIDIHTLFTSTEAYVLRCQSSDDGLLSVAQVVECLSSKRKTLRSNPSTAKRDPPKTTNTHTIKNKKPQSSDNCMPL